MRFIQDFGNQNFKKKETNFVAFFAKRYTIRGKKREETKVKPFSVAFKEGEKKKIKVSVLNLMLR